jgi:hypothetical protein
VAETSTGSAVAGARMTFDKTIHVVVDIFLPIGSALAGIFMPTALGGGTSVANAVYKVQGGTGSGSLANRVAWGIQALINGAVGAAFWSLRGHDGLVAKVLGNVIGGFFLGSAIGCIPGVVSGTQPTPGIIDKLVSGVENIAQEG